MDSDKIDFEIGNQNALVGKRKEVFLTEDITSPDHKRGKLVILPAATTVHTPFFSSSPLYQDLVN